MGDHCASIKIEFEMHNVKDSCDFWINWSPDPNWNDMDRRVCEWMKECVDRAMESYFDRVYAPEVLLNADKEKQERAELARLKEKYGNE